jgi:signal transduction histidine kinase
MTFHNVVQPSFQFAFNSPSIRTNIPVVVFGRQRFECEHDKKKSAIAGAGLGLTIVRDIAALRGARITLSDREHGSGLKISVIFPAL